MNPALARLLTRLYPSPWRERYGPEFEAFLQTGPSGIGPSMNIVWSALCEHIGPTRASNMDPNPNSLSSLRTLSTLRSTLKHPSARLPFAMSLTVLGLLLGAGIYNIFHVETLRAQLLHPASEPLPSFEVATIRPSHADGTKLGFRMTPAEFKVQNASITDLIRFAYMVKSTAQLPQEPHWINSDKFDIDAKIAETQIEVMKKLTPDHRFEQNRFMVQSLLSERFGLKLSSQMKNLAVYALVVAKGGPRLKEVEGLSPPQSGPAPPTPPHATNSATTPGLAHMPTLTGGRGELKAGEVSMHFFTDWVSRQPEMADRVVIDATGLKGSYNFELNWSPDDDRTPLLNGVPQESTGPSIFTAFQEQLGLKLESRRAPVEVLVIDHVEPPSQN
jgi:uncharacterized protein (TIGR03435 family)